MKPPADVAKPSSRLLLPILALLLLSAAAFSLGRLWPGVASTLPLSFLPSPAAVSLSPNAAKSFRLPLVPAASPPPPPPPPPSPPPPVALIERMGVVDSDGRMTDDFKLGEFNKDEVEEWEKAGNETKGSGGEEDVGVKVKVGRFRMCPGGMVDHVPCWDSGKGSQRRCPAEEKGLSCLVPAPKDYRRPIWPRCRDEVFYSNLRNTPLVNDKGLQGEIIKRSDKFRFLGGAKFPRGVDQYLNQISKLVPDIKFGQNIRVALDVGCGVGSFGASLLLKNVTTLSISAKNGKDNSIQVVLERGAPAMVATLDTNRLLYPSQAFDLIQCADSQINWFQNGGISLLEINRVLRAGGYFVWAAETQAWAEMEDLTKRICWELVKKEGYISIWRKPLKNNCYINRHSGALPPLCDTNDDPDEVWHVSMKPCITRLPEDGLGANVTVGTNRIYNPPDRLQVVKMDADISKPELLKAETKYWTEVVGTYVRAYRWNTLKLQNVMDMRAGYGGFAVALAANNLNAWVMNVVPTTEPNMLPVIYDRGLIGVAHDWCEPFDTYPRTYDLLHAAFLFSKEKKRCNITNILLEMDRMLRPSGRAYIRDSTAIINEVKEIADAMGWRCSLRLTEEGLYSSRRFLGCDK